MPLGAHNGKLLYGSGDDWYNTLRGCCCCTWAMSAVSYTIGGDEPKCSAAPVYLPSVDDPSCYYGTLAEVAAEVAADTYVNLNGYPSCCRPPDQLAVRVYPSVQTVSETGNTGHATATLTLGVCDEENEPTSYTFEYDFITRTHPL